MNGLGGILRSELTKTVTHPVCVGAMVLMVVLPLALAVGMLDATVLADWELGVARGAMVGQLGAVLFAAGVVGQEFEGRCLRSSCVVVPSRGRLLGAKLLLVVVVVAVLTCVWWLAALALQSAGGGFDLTAADTSRSLLLMAASALSWSLLACLSAGLSLLTSSLVAPVAVLAPLMLGVSQMLYLLTPAARFLPDLAGYQLVSTELFPALLPPAAGAAVQFLWAAVAVTLGAAVLLRRDVR